jgi:hypothetical protein
LGEWPAAEPFAAEILAMLLLLVSVIIISAFATD